ncbi:MAG TPA: carboxypeptidase regulatory-like domain-containing protein [Gemmatimonadaceae bacterium]|nr:carboxypeptidase regulatory-like domain-containing protein [Gemmatimonadaceae bacterium]
MRCSILVAGLLVPGVLQAQRVQVALRDSTDQSPIARALVSLVDATGATVAEALTDAAGHRDLAAAAGGQYRVRVRRIGYEPYLSAPLSLTPGATIPLALAIPAAKVDLAAVRVTGARTACGSDPAGALGAAELWEQITTALASSEVARRDTVVRIAVHRFDRELRPNGTPFDANVRDLGTSEGRPFETKDPATLSRDGYAALTLGYGGTYWAPDERALLSPQFVHDHCFHVVEGHGADSALVGIAFEPAADRGVVDIAGTLWVDRAHATLDRVDYQYVHLDLPVRAKDVGGDVHFAVAPNGAWYPSVWRIRMPRIRQIGVSTTQYTLGGYTEVGGTAVPIGAAGAQAAIAAVPSQQTTVDLAVVVRDVRSGAPISNAMVRLADANRDARTDSAGTLRFGELPAGTHQISVRGIGYVPIDTAVTAKGESVRLTIELVHTAPMLDTIRVLAAPLSVRMQEFETRRKMGIGDFLTDSVIAKEGNRPLTSVLVTHLPGLRLVSAPPFTQKDTKACGLDSLCGNDLDYGGMRLAATGTSDIMFDSKPGCPVNVYIDGFYYTDNLEAVPTEKITAAELYAKGSEPPAYRRQGKACKTLLLWTKNK